MVMWRPRANGPPLMLDQVCVGVYPPIHFLIREASFLRERCVLEPAGRLLWTGGGLRPQLVVGQSQGTQTPPTTRFVCSTNLPCMILECGRRAQYLEKSDAGTGRACKLHAGCPQPKSICLILKNSTKNKKRRRSKWAFVRQSCALTFFQPAAAAHQRSGTGGGRGARCRHGGGRRHHQDLLATA